MEQTFSLSFKNEDPESTDRKLIIEQDEYPANTGKLTIGNFASMMETTLTGKMSGNVIWMECGVDMDGAYPALNTIIRVYPGVIGDNYKLHTSYGSLTNRTVEQYKCEDIVSFNGNDSVSFKYPVDTIISMQILGDILDSDWNKISNHGIRINSERTELLADKEIYGLVKVSYYTYRHNYDLSVIARPESETDVFGAVVYGVFDGGVSWLEIEIPNYADIIATGKASCGYTFDWLDDVDNDNPPEFAPKVDREIEIDYCTQEVMSDTIKYV